MAWHLSDTISSIRHSALRGLVIASMGSVASGCDYVERWAADPQPSMTSGGWLTNYESYTETFDLISALDPNGRSQSMPYWSQDAPLSKKIDLAFVAFYDPAYKLSTQKMRRNRIQERMLAVSNGRCALFKNLLYELRSKSNFWLGALTTVTGVAGGIVTGATGSRALAGAAGAFSGTRAEFNQEMFQNLATQVIIEGIDVRRREIYEEIIHKGQSKKIDGYEVEAAVKDAIYYHAQCNVVTGFQVAQDSIKTVEDPGINAANRTLARLATTRALLQNRKLTSKEAASLVVTSSSILGKAGKPTVKSPEDDLPATVLMKVRSDVASMITAFEFAVKNRKISENVKSSDVDDVLKAASAAKTNALDHLGACQKKALEAGTAAYHAIKVAELPGMKRPERIQKQVDKEKKLAAAAKWTRDIRAVGKALQLRVSSATALLSEALNDAKEIDKSENVAAMAAELKKSVAVGACTKK
jgi:hypothetical protein